MIEYPLQRTFLRPQKILDSKLPQMTRLEVGQLGWRNLAIGSFWLPTSYFTILTAEVGPYTIIQFEIQTRHLW